MPGDRLDIESITLGHGPAVVIKAALSFDSDSGLEEGFGQFALLDSRLHTDPLSMKLR